MIRQVLAAVSLALICGGVANAQTLSAATPPASASPAAATPQPQMVQPPGEPTDARRKSARQIVELLHPEYELSTIMANKLNPFAIRLTLDDPNNVERARAVNEAESKVLKETAPVLKMLLAEGYAREMSQEQLDDTLKFLGTPSGLAFSHARGRLPLYFEISGADIWGQFVHAMLADFCTRTSCTSKDLALLNEHMGPERY